MGEAGVKMGSYFPKVTSEIGVRSLAGKTNRARTLVIQVR
jgi:hypothetical protein